MAIKMKKSLKGHPNIARILLKHEDSPNIKYRGKREVLLLAAEKGKLFFCLNFM